MKLICPLIDKRLDIPTTCYIERCQLWDDGNKCCSLKSISIELIKLNEGIRDVSTSPRGGK